VDLCQLLVGLVGANSEPVSSGSSTKIYANHRHWYAVVFTPQIIENWKRSSADGLSVVFIVIWLLGDIFNILGAVLQGVLPTMVSQKNSLLEPQANRHEIILAVYYTFADIVLLLQCFYYKGFTLKDEVIKPATEEEGASGPSTATANERSPLLSQPNHPNHPSYQENGHSNGHRTPPRIGDVDRRHSHSSLRERLLSVDGTHLSPVTPLRPDVQTTTESQPRPAQSLLKAALFNFLAIIIVCASGVLGWYFSVRSSRPSTTPPDHPDNGPLQFSVWGQVSGYICAFLYLGSRIPQLLLNYRRKSTEGISMLFFLFACIGNLTYVLSIFAYKPICRDPLNCRRGEAGGIYARYIAVNFSWLLGSFGTLLLDGFVFIQYFLYLKDEEDTGSEDTAST